MKFLKRCISCAVAAALVAVSAGLTAIIHADDTYTVNMAMADAVLYGKRSFVKSSLLNDDFSDNPHALVNGIGSEKSMMANVLSQYQNEDDENYSAAYKLAVDIM